MLRPCALMIAITLGEAALSPLQLMGSDNRLRQGFGGQVSVASPRLSLLEEIAARDEAADAAVAEIRTPEDLKAFMDAYGIREIPPTEY